MSHSTKTFGTFAASGLTVVLLASGCSLQAKSGPPSLHFDLSSLAQRNSVSGITLVTNGFEDFACFAINVTGPGIDDSDPYRTDKDPAKDFALTIGGSPCAYRGIVSPPIYVSSATAMQGELALKLPPGPVRMVQLIGVKDLASCQRGFIDPMDVNQNVENYYELGRAEVRDFFQDRSVALPLVAWSTLTTSEQEELNMDSCHDDGGSNLPDTTPPVVTLGTVPALVTASPLNIAVTATETLGAYCKQVNNLSVGACSWVNTSPGATLTVALTDNQESDGPSNKVSLWVKDLAGNVSARVDTSVFRYDSPTLGPVAPGPFVTAIPGGPGKVNVTVNVNAYSYYNEVCIKDSLSNSPMGAAGCVWVPYGSHQHTATSGSSVYIHTFTRDSHGNISPESVSALTNVGV